MGEYEGGVAATTLCKRVLVALKLSLDLNRLDTLGVRPRGLKGLLLKARSANGKATAMQDLILHEQAGPACISETWLAEAGVSVSLSFARSIFFAAAGKTWGIGGGIAVVCHESISFTSCHIHQYSRFKCVYLKVGT